MNPIIDAVDLSSLNITELQKQKLKALFPEVFTEGNKIDFDRLKMTLGEVVEVNKERFGMSWAGKADCFKTIQQPSIATLVPARDESVDFDSTENVFIEGDNLEVLKLLQKSYLGKVKMIYIDPPYNTGSDFIYPDNYSENLETYLEYTGQVDGEGRKFSTNVETDGRFHSKWMNMMYPRLFLAKNLLREDGVIFISIDDNEAHNLRALCNEIFGEENFLAQYFIKVRYEGKTLVEDMDFQKLIESVLIYRKSMEFKPKKISSEYSLDKFCYEIVEIGSPIVTEIGGKKVEIFSQDKYKILPCSPSIKGLKEIWASGKILDGNSSGRFFRDYLSGRSDNDGLNILYKVYGIGDDGLGYRYFTGPKKLTATKGKYFQGVPLNVADSFDSSSKESPIVTYYDFSDAFGNCRHEGGVDFRSGKKPVRFIQKLFDIVDWSSSDIVLDFFAGSASTAHAIMDFNIQEKNNINYICVQLPEVTYDLIDGSKKAKKESQFAFDAGYEKISEISKERIRRAAAKIKAEQTEAQAKPDLFDDGTANTVLDLGFRVFKLQKSNFKVWDANTPKDSEAIQQALELHVDHIDPSASQEAILFELLLKSGFELTTPIKNLTLANKEVYSIADNALLICLDKALTPEVIRAMAELNPSRVICLDEGFQDNDQLKTNAVLIMKSQGVNDFRTV